MGTSPVPPSFMFLLCYPIPGRSVDRRAFCLPPRGKDKARLGTARALYWGGAALSSPLYLRQECPTTRRALACSTPGHPPLPSFIWVPLPLLFGRISVLHERTTSIKVPHKNFYYLQPCSGLPAYPNVHVPVP